MVKVEPEIPTTNSHLRTLKRFASFWSSVSDIQVAESVSIDTQMAIIRGMERAYGKESSST